MAERMCFRTEYENIMQPTAFPLHCGWNGSCDHGVTANFRRGEPIMTAPILIA
jgi:hypothetical protein